jgi:Zn-dependent protease with chaperone function
MRLLRVATSVVVLAALIAPVTFSSQTKVKPGMNFFSIEKDIELGRQAASQLERQMPMVTDPVVQRWIDTLGRRIVSQSSMPNLPWRFRVVNSGDINAFALPGGFVYFNRGLIDITDDESEIAGVMGHEGSHVVLRHGTNQLSKAYLYSAPLAVLGSAGGAAGAIGQLGGVGLSMAFLKFSRDAEKQADILGVQTMVKAGYDPRGMIRIFERLERVGGGKGPQFLSDHPSPDKRAERIQKEIAQIGAPTNPLPSSSEYIAARNRLRSLGPAPRTSPRNSGSSGRDRQPTRSSSRYGEPPSSTFQTFRPPDGLFQVGYPSNWQAYSQTGTNVTFAPDWATDGNEISHGSIVSYFDPQAGRGRVSLEDALDTIVRQLEESNTYLREEQRSRYGGRLAGREAMATFLQGRNNSGNDERLWLIVRPSGAGIIYMVFVAPERDFESYKTTFASMIRSFSVSDR